MIEKKWVVFYNTLTGEELCRYSIEDTFLGEMKDTVGLLAYKYNIAEDDVKIKIE